jgi:predicted DNA-binding WGR domain protein
MKLRYRYTDHAENSNKVWDIDEAPQVGDDGRFRVEVRWGKFGAPKLRSQVKAFDSFLTANEFIMRKTQEKLQKGYRRIGLLDDASKAGASHEAPGDEEKISLGHVKKAKQAAPHVPDQFEPEPAAKEDVAKLRASLKRGRDLFS